MVASRYWIVDFILGRLSSACLVLTVGCRRGLLSQAVMHVISRRSDAFTRLPFRSEVNLRGRA